MHFPVRLLPIASALFCALLACVRSAAAPAPLTPPPPDTPRINGADVFGVRPGSPFLYTIPATGIRPMSFAADNLPAGLAVDPATGRITGKVARPGDYAVELRARNALGSAERRFTIKVGETICLTPPMGWNSWNHYATRVNQDIVLRNAQAMAASGLIEHGWTYINIDDSWQGLRGGPYRGLQGNEKFPDMAGLCRDVHALGLKIGIYSTPWEQSYAGFAGGSADNPEGRWVKATGRKRVNHNIPPWAIGSYPFARNDAEQWAAWGFDYLKYDWNPIEVPETRQMYDALRASGRDIVLSLSNSTPFANIPALSQIANCWRIGGDIKSNWKSMIREALSDDKWRPYAGPGHWNDPDMLEIGTKERKQPGLTPDEEYTHMSFWCLLSAPLLLGTDLTHMSPFTLGLLTNDEVLALDQDSLGRQAWRISQAQGDTGELAAVVYAKPLEDGSWAVGLFNLSAEPRPVALRWSDLGIQGSWVVRDLWRQRDIGPFDGRFESEVAPHGVVLVRLRRS